ncbi:MAG: endo alpha-1,4 polygalactosaminidase [Candidatus Marinimicrobia bacterium]|nr:endo alpha-1,4 polygalactosaminidase [Candidatus Neomarinimicrobiota bacterium]MBL7023753.1 endo alpha-1,4 polygalactosaminidase [Candidatus Neomarinimicrobiota bacterium]MBL7108950.1 endo alpha-1,4 polygalactosaminidase [Candidatus Neomarinimicrobiota bacterium]
MKNILAFTFIIFAFSQTLENVNSWAYQLQNLDPAEVSQNTTFEMIVMDYSVSGSDNGAYSAEEIQLIKNSNKLAICYISIGEAEDYRSYWQSSWSSNPPEWLGAENPDWAGNFKVKFWYPEWQNIIFTWLDTIIAQGFDGIYMDIIDAYYYWMEEVPNPQQEPYAAVYMIDFVENIRNYLTENGGENMVIIPQNGEYIVLENYVTENDVQRYLSTCDAIGVEDLFFYGNQDMNNSYNPDEERLELLTDIYQPGGWPIFSIEYLTHQNKINQYLQVAEVNNFIPYCSVRDLDVLTDGFGVTELGDVNSDGTIDVLDATLVANYILGIESEIQNADMNNDGLVNVIDIVMLINLIIGD